MVHKTTRMQRVLFYTVTECSLHEECDMVMCADVIHHQQKRCL